MNVVKIVWRKKAQNSIVVEKANHEKAIYFQQGQMYSQQHLKAFRKENIKRS